jgi:hypothetical protein
MPYILQNITFNYTFEVHKYKSYDNDKEPSLINIVFKVLQDAVLKKR